MGEAGAGHALAEAALLDKIFFEAEELLVDQVVRLVDQANHDVGNDLRRPGLDEFAVNLVGLGFTASELADKAGFLGIFLPDRKIPQAQEVEIVVERAAWIIWSMVRSPRERYLWANRNVRS